MYQSTQLYMKHILHHKQKQLLFRTKRTLFITQSMAKYNLRERGNLINNKIIHTPFLYIY